MKGPSVEQRISNTDSTTKTRDASQRRAPIGRWVKIRKADNEYPFEHGESIHHTLDGINTPSYYKDTGVLPNSVARENVNSSGISP
jgi:hypothetical protein